MKRSKMKPSLRAGGEAIVFLWKKIATGKKRPRNDRTGLLLLVIVFFCGVRLEAQENVGAWPSVEAGPVISQGVSVNVKDKTSERVVATPGTFAQPAAFSTAGFPGNRAGPRIFHAPVTPVAVPPVVPEKIATGLSLPFLEVTPEKIAYPKKAVRRGWEGCAVLTYEVLTDGSVGQIELTQSSGHTLLDETAREAVQKWKFHPALKDGKPIRDIVSTPVTFKLEGQPE